MPLAVSAQQKVARETSMPLFPNNWASHLLRGSCWVVRIGKRSPKWPWLKDKEREKPVKMEQKKIRELELEPQVKQTALLASPIYIGQAQGEEEKHIIRGAKIGPLVSLLFKSFGVGQPDLIPQGSIFLCLPNKTEL